MFKNSVFKVSVNTKQWLKAACVRAVKTMVQTGKSGETSGKESET